MCFIQHISLPEISQALLDLLFHKSQREELFVPQPRSAGIPLLGLAPLFVNSFVSGSFDKYVRATYPHVLYINSNPNKPTNYCIPSLLV